MYEVLNLLLSFNSLLNFNLSPSFTSLLSYNILLSFKPRFNLLLKFNLQRAELLARPRHDLSQDAEDSLQMRAQIYTRMGRARRDVGITFTIQLVR